MKKCIPLLTVLCLLCCLMLRADAAGIVTDTLTVKVGYWGMDTDSYVEVATYHWSELEENLPLHQQAYSFFRPDASGDYRIAIDSAYGFYLTDLLSYAGIYQGDVLSLQFYTQDQSVGYFTSFTSQDLFGTQRYYYEDLAAYIRPVYGEDGQITSWDATEAWSHCRQVPAMLALEDSWVWYDIGTEHTAPDYENLGTGNRFRLLFGQASPLETRTNQTAKYTHTVYVTLQGAPELGELPSLDASIGSHSLDFTVTVGNQSVLSAIASLLQIESTDDSVLHISGIQITPDETYSDLVHVEIDYEVLKEGEAALNFSLGGASLGSSPSISPGTHEGTGENDGTGVGGETDSGGDTPSGQGDAESGKPAPAPIDSTPSGETEQKTEAAGSKQAQEGSTAQVLHLTGEVLTRWQEKSKSDTAHTPAEAVEQLTVSAEENAAAAWLFPGFVFLLLLGGLAALLYYKKIAR